MKSIGIVLLIVFAFLGLALMLSKTRDLSPRPQEVADEQRLADLQKEQAAAQNKTQPPAQSNAQPAAAESNYLKDPVSIPPSGTLTAVMTVKGRGDVTLELFGKDAPETVKQFATLAKNGFYNGVKVHRVVDGFVVQAGDPKSRTMTTAEVVAANDGEGGTQGLGDGGSGHNVPFEKNARKNETGTLAMALSAPQSATGDSQFFINLADNAQLNGDYCVFGRVTQGMNVVNSIKRGDEIQKITVK